jgi:branched-chain amino acid transport system substrate-binding protein
MKAFKRSLLALALAGAMGAAQAQVSDGVIKIGVLSDMSSLYTDLAGAGSVAAAKMAVEDSGIEKRGYKVAIISADHQNKPDVGSAIARQWDDTAKVDVSSTRRIPASRSPSTRSPGQGKAFLVSARRARSDGQSLLANTITGPTIPGCSPTARASAIVKTGGDTGC